ncbi:MAG: hypothetical protein AAGC60_08640 [Acidobacteriota bacterium]
MRILLIASITALLATPLAIAADSPSTECQSLSRALALDANGLPKSALNQALASTADLASACEAMAVCRTGFAVYCTVGGPGATCVGVDAVDDPAGCGYVTCTNDETTETLRCPFCGPRPK